ncbi:MAG: bifunctional [glutamate--ammonia ligase]-adenylyl-L-tyrosine phosphorylase/[glutamate--ammonia-ligase] adenylyltransferase [Burkholderiales bacterium]|nr:bifunctional [glutamate--ammonia ligase]-adenylyl-L-tyrosine phosphorylase/[glutamate--ammonia-ligase] adenylyltransferase [Burkholderiales bacterium]
MDLERALSYSRYAQRAFAADVTLAQRIETAAGAAFDWSAESNRPPESPDAATAARWLRDLRRRVFLHTMVRDLTGRAPLAEVCATMTRLADVAVTAATSLHTAELSSVHGAPTGSETATPQSLIVLGMGKLGGGELNVSSDIDLVFVYPEEGETAGPRVIANREYFDRLGRRIITTLNDATADGYVFRVDMRLRPYGDSGPLTTSFAALEAYLITQGRAWERYAWLKARAITGDRHDELDALVTPFIYRKYLDFDVYEGLRDIHRQIRDQGARRDYADNIKLGDGGIREIEFIVQALQIVRGGREPELRIRGTLPALAILGERGLLPGTSIDALRDAYLFLRGVEHRLQYRDDEQTHTLPADTDERALLAESVGDTPEAFAATLKRHRSVVSLTFAQTLGDDDSAVSVTDEIFTSTWDDPRPSKERCEALRAAGYADAAALTDSLVRVRASSRYQLLPAASRQRFDTLLPRVLAVASAHPGLEGAQVVFGRLLSLLETIARRSAYLALIIEHPPLLPRLANLMGASAWAAEYLARHPLLLDELLDARALLAEPDWDAWRVELARLLASNPADAEHQMDALRHFQHAQSFRLLMQDLDGRLTVERLADHLSALADAVLDAALAACWTQMTSGDVLPPRFAIIGYGKLGGKELGYASDLDLVFLFDIDADDADSDASEARYTRLGQRLNTWLTSTTSAGQLYDTDLRLRPDGAKGLLVSSLRAFQKYQRENAWIWEHQALTRARFVAGDAAVGTAFENLRESLLRLAREPAGLAHDVVDMRRRMHAGHPNPTRDFDLKHDSGGMVDIEFTVQYLVLAHAHRHALLTRNAGNIALLGFAGDLGLLPAALAEEAADAYREYRRLQHKVRLTGAAHARVEPGPQVARRATVQALWTRVFGTPWTEAPPRPATAAGA